MYGLTSPVRIWGVIDSADIGKQKKESQLAKKEARVNFIPYGPAVFVADIYIFVLAAVWLAVRVF